MDQTMINATEDYLKSQIAQKDERIQQLEEHVQRVTQRDYSTAANLNAMRDGMQTWTIEALEQREISQTNAEEIAEICGFELTKEVEVEVNVTYYISVEVPAGEDVDSIISDIDFDAITYDIDKITHVSSSVDNVDY